MTEEKIFFDNASTTRIDPEVLKEMIPYLKQHYGNPSSLHDFSDKPKKAVDRARKQTADLIGADEEEIYFTSCGTDQTTLHCGVWPGQIKTEEII